jgi:hypothetical protein
MDSSTIRALERMVKRYGSQISINRRFMDLVSELGAFRTSHHRNKVLHHAFGHNNRRISHPGCLESFF